MIDRSEVNRALAEAIAYKQCGKDREAGDAPPDRAECANILRPEGR
jgi:hypothetical protein